MIDLDFEVQAHGPLFDGRVEQGLIRAQRTGIREVVDRGFGILNQVLTMRPAGVYLSVEEAEPGKASKGYYRGHLHGEVRDSSFGYISDSGVIYGPWLQGTGSANATSRFKGYAAFRHTGQRLAREAGTIMQSVLNRVFRV